MRLKSLLFATCSLALLGLPAQAAGEFEQVQQLHRQGRTALAMEQAERFLAAHPRDAQMRFFHAGMLGDTGKVSEATAMLQRLTEDFPTLAEPYNNLAALYARSGEYGKARDALEQALRLNPNYATAHENLGDVQAALAAQSYSAALRLEPGRRAISPKLALVRQLTTPAKPTAAASAASN